MHESEGPPVSQPDRGPQIPDSTPADFWGNKERINELVLLVISIFRQISTKVLLSVWSGDLLVLFCCKLVVVYFSFRSKNLCIFIFFHLLNASLTRWRLSLNYLVFNQCSLHSLQKFSCVWILTSNKQICTFLCVRLTKDLAELKLAAVSMT